MQETPLIFSDKTYEDTTQWLRQRRSSLNTSLQCQHIFHVRACRVLQRTKPSDKNYSAPHFKSLFAKQAEWETVTDCGNPTPQLQLSHSHSSEIDSHRRGLHSCFCFVHESTSRKTRQQSSGVVAVVVYCKVAVQGSAERSSFLPVREYDVSQTLSFLTTTRR